MLLYYCYYAQVFFFLLFLNYFTEICVDKHTPTRIRMTVYSQNRPAAYRWYWRWAFYDIFYIVVYSSIQMWSIGTYSQVEQFDSCYLSNIVYRKNEILHENVRNRYTNMSFCANRPHLYICFEGGHTSFEIDLKFLKCISICREFSIFEQHEHEYVCICVLSHGLYRP